METATSHALSIHSPAKSIAFDSKFIHRIEEIRNMYSRKGIKKNTIHEPRRSTSLSRLKKKIHLKHSHEYRKRNSYRVSSRKIVEIFYQKKSLQFYDTSNCSYYFDSAIHFTSELYQDRNEKFIHPIWLPAETVVVVCSIDEDLIVFHSCALIDWPIIAMGEICSVVRKGHVRRGEDWAISQNANRTVTHVVRFMIFCE